MRLFEEHAYSTGRTQNYQCRAMRGDGVYFLAHILRLVEIDDGRGTVTLMNASGEYSVTLLVTRPVSLMRIIHTIPEHTMATERAPWKKIARLDAVDLLLEASKKVKLSDSVASSALAQRIFKFKKNAGQGAAP